MSTQYRYLRSVFNCKFMLHYVYFLLLAPIEGDFDYDLPCYPGEDDYWCEEFCGSDYSFCDDYEEVCFCRNWYITYFSA